MRLMSLHGAARSGNAAKPHFPGPRRPVAGPVDVGPAGAGQKPHVGWRLVCRSRRERGAVGTGRWSREPRRCGNPWCRPHSLGAGGFLSGLLLWPPDHVAKEPGDAERQELALPGRALAESCLVGLI